MFAHPCKHQPGHLSLKTFQLVLIFWFFGSPQYFVNCAQILCSVIRIISQGNVTRGDDPVSFLIHLTLYYKKSHSVFRLRWIFFTEMLKCLCVLWVFTYSSFSMATASVAFYDTLREKMTAPPCQTPPSLNPPTPLSNTPLLWGGGSVCGGICPLTARHLKSSGLLVSQMGQNWFTNELCWKRVITQVNVRFQLEKRRVSLIGEIFWNVSDLSEIHSESVRFGGACH